MLNSRYVSSIQQWRVILLRCNLIAGIVHNWRCGSFMVTPYATDWWWYSGCPSAVHTKDLRRRICRGFIGWRRRPHSLYRSYRLHRHNLECHVIRGTRVRRFSAIPPQQLRRDELSKNPMQFEGKISFASSYLFINWHPSPKWKIEIAFFFSLTRDGNFLVRTWY